VSPGGSPDRLGGRPDREVGLGAVAALQAEASGDTADRVLPPGWRLVLRDAVPSTSTVLAELAAAGEPEGLALLARRQTSGRGREGRRWESPEGNLHLSVLMRPPGAAREAAQWSLTAGVALAEVAAVTDPEPLALRLKWPNDLLRHGAKVGGILAESALASDHAGAKLAWLVLGFGVNLAAAPRLPDRPTAALGHEAGPPEAFAARLLRCLDHWRGVRAREGFDPVRAAWMALGPEIGTGVAVRAGADGLVITGRYAGLAEDGSLLLEADDGSSRRIAAGEVTPVAGAMEAG
jgi:BirA family biotin operon repressor/biotin-[acetyl-CoA-carboxylase] ligase